MRVTVYIGVAVLGSVFGGLRCVASGQATTERFHASALAGSTVSVATLRVPEKAWRHFAKAKEASEHNREAEADRETYKALAIAPNFAEAYLLRAGSQVHARCYEAAIESVSEARRVEPDVAWAAVLLAGAYNGLHRYKDARLALRNLHGVESASWQASYEAARAATGLNDVPGALRWSAIALEAAPENFADARLVRANALLVARRWSEAQAQMELYLQAKGASDHRSAVLTALDGVKRRLREEELQKVAAR